MSDADQGVEKPIWAEICDVQPFGKYYLISKLAEGGMAEIFLAKHMGPQGFERDVVVKRMLKHLTEVPDFVSMFLDEARLAAKLFHQHIVQITDLGVSDGMYYICMEYLPGEDVAHVISAWRARGEPIPAGIAARIILEAAEGLDFAHTFAEGGRPVNIVHRDVTPSNILVTYNGTVKVVDFGIAKAETKVAKTGIGTVKGKWVYMSPEQARGEVIDKRSDVFSLGLTFYELLTGVRVFQRDNELAILKALLNGPIPSPRQYRQDLPDALEAVLRKALTRDLKQRYQSAAQMARDLENFLASTSSSSGGRQLAHYMKGLFGDDRMTLKTQIPTLAALEQMGVNVPKPDAAPPPTETGRAAGGAGGTRAALHPEFGPGPGDADLPATRATSRRDLVPAEKRRWTLYLAAAAAVALLAGGATYLALFRQPPGPVQQQGGGGTGPIAGGGEAGRDATGAVEPEGEPDAGELAEAGPDAGAVKHTNVEERPVKLTAKIVQQRVKAHGDRLSSCFSKHSGLLQSQQGQVTLTFTVLQSGKISDAKVSTPGFESNALGDCIVAQVKAMRFPRHVDPPLTIHVPFVYSVK